MYKQAIAKIWGIPKSQVIRLNSGEYSIQSPKIPSGIKKIEVRFSNGSFWTLAPWGWVNLTEIAQNLMNSSNPINPIKPANDKINPLNIGGVVW